LTFSISVEKKEIYLPSLENKADSRIKAAEIIEGIIGFSPMAVSTGTATPTPVCACAIKALATTSTESIAKPIKKI